MKEITDPGIVTIAVDHLVPEVILVVLQFILDIRQLGVEVVVLVALGRLKILVQRHV